MMKLLDKFKFINENMKVILLGQLITNIAYFAIIPFLSFYFTNSFFDIGQVGKLITYRALFNVIGIIIGGIIADNFSTKKVVVISLSTMVIFFLILIYSQDYLVYLTILSGIGLLYGISYPSESIMIMNNSNDENRATIFAILRVLINISACLAPILLVQFFDRLKLITFFIFAMLYLIYVLFIVLFYHEKEDLVVNQKIEIRKLLKKEVSNIYNICKDFNFIFILFSLTLSTVSTFFISTTLALYLKLNVQDNPEEIYKLIVILNTWLVIFFQIPISSLSIKLTYTKAAILGQFLVSISFIILLLNDSYLVFFTSFVILTLGEMFISPGAMLLVIDNCKNNNLGKYLSIGKLRIFLALPLSSALGSYFLSKKSEELLLIILSVISFIGGIILIIIRNKIKDSSRY